MPAVTNNEVLVESLTEALETIAFMMALPPEEELPEPEQGMLVTIEFNGPISGAIELWTGTELAQMLAQKDRKTYSLIKNGMRPQLMALKNA